MSYFEKTRILSADSPSIDGFGKWRVSNPTTLFDSKQIVDSGSFYFDWKKWGNATASYQSGAAQTVLKVNQTSGSRVVRQTRRIFVYQPGKSQQIICTGTYGNGVDGIKKSIGSFDDFDGLFFQQSGSSFGCVLRKTINGVKTDTFYSQSDWNIDKMDGYGPSRNTIDLTKAQIFEIDYEWLGVGRVRYGVVQKGLLNYVHEISNYNSLDNVYLRNPNLPIRYEITTHKNTTTGSLLKQICSTVISEGGFSSNGRRIPISNENGSSISTSQYAAVLAIRYNPNSPKCGQIISETFDLLVNPGNSSPFTGRWSLLLNPTLASTPTFTNVTGSSVIQAARPSVGINVTNTGTPISVGYFAGTAGGGISERISIDPFYGLGRKIDGTSDIIVVAIKAINNNYTVYPTLTVRELT